MKRILVAPYYRDDRPLQGVINALPAVIRERGERVKSDSRGEVYLIEDDKHRLAVKRFPPIWTPPGRILRRVTKGRWGTAVWRRLCRAHGLGLPIATPIGLHQPQGMVGEAYLVLRWIEGMSVDEWLLEPSRADVEREALTGDLAQLITQMHGAGITHGDLKPRNVVVENGKPVLIDPDGIRLHLTGLGLRKRARRDWKTITGELAMHPIEPHVLAPLINGAAGIPNSD